jgi:hypothetical protein
MLALSLELPVDTSAPDTPQFTDVPAGAWYAPYVQALASRGIIKGEQVNGKLYFQPDRPISRQEAATIIPRSVPLTAAPPPRLCGSGRGAGVGISGGAGAPGSGLD